MSTLNLNATQGHLVRHYAIGIAIGLVLGLVAYFIFTTFLNEDQPTNSYTPLVQDLKTEVEQVSQSQGVDKADKPQKSELVDGDPQTVWKDLQENNQIHIGRIVELINTTNAWIAQDGLGILNELHKSVTDSEVRAALFGSVIFTAAEEIGFQDLFYKAKESLEDSELRREFLWRLTRMWTPSDPIGAFAATSKMENTYERVEMWKSIAGVWAMTNLQSIEELLHTMPEPVVNHAELMVMIATAQQSPADAVTFLPRVAGTPYEQMLAKEIADHWKKIDVDQALNWALDHKFSNKRIRNHTMASVLHEVAKEDLDHALKIARSEPTDKYGKGPEGFLVSLIAHTDIDQAIKLLAQVRDGPTAMHAYVRVGANLTRQYDFDRAMELGGQIQNDQNKGIYYDYVLREWATNDPIKLHKKIPLLHSEKLRSRAAMHLVEVESYRNKVLSEGQLQEARVYMTRRDYGELVDRRGRMSRYNFEQVLIDPTPDSPLSPAVAEHLNSLFQRSF